MYRVKVLQYSKPTYYPSLIQKIPIRCKHDTMADQQLIKDFELGNTLKYLGFAHFRIFLLHDPIRYSNQVDEEIKNCNEARSKKAEKCYRNSESQVHVHLVLPDPHHVTPKYKPR